MSDATVTKTESAPTTTGRPPIALLFPLLQPVLVGVSFLFYYGLRLLLVVVFSLRTIWTIIYAILSPIFILLQIALHLVLFTPLSIIYAISVALYPVYVFFAIACILGATIGIFGNYFSTSILSVLAQSKYFTQPTIPPSVPVPPSSPQVMLRKRKRRSVRLQ